MLKRIENWTKVQNVTGFVVVMILAVYALCGISWIFGLIDSLNDTNKFDAFVYGMSFVPIYSLHLFAVAAVAFVLHRIAISRIDRVNREIDNARHEHAIYQVRKNYGRS